MRRGVTVFGLLAAILVVLIGVALTLARTEAMVRAEALAGQSEVARTPHGLVEYAIRGEGPPVLVIHGAGGGFDQGLLLAEAVGGPGRRWISVSRFGYLRSPLPENASTAAQADALADLLTELEIERVDVLAMSGGAPPALQLAAQHPERVSAMVLLSPAPFTPFGGDVEGRPVPAAVYTAIAGSDVGFWLMKRLAPGTLRSAFDARPELLEAAEDIDFVDRLVEGFQPASGRLAGLRNEIAAVDPQAEYDLETIRAPVLVVHAADDRLNPVAISETIAARISNAEFIRYNTGGHLLLGHHDDLREAIPEFLAAP
ncbi:alpha/beta fold hydrolase [Hyphomonas sp. NPDC076900]|uniref:alpha/beta fold hydrolase n=1 Tax=unclassified Hyphomonas TaxID=2630699 RepID=UPI003D0325B5